VIAFFALIIYLVLTCRMLLGLSHQYVVCVYANHNVVA